MRTRVVHEATVVVLSGGPVAANLLASVVDGVATLAEPERTLVVDLSAVELCWGGDATSVLAALGRRLNGSAVRLA